MQGLRRNFAKSIAAAGLAALLPARAILAGAKAVHKRPIPATGEQIPAIGMGSWLTFDIANSGNLTVQMEQRCTVLQAFFDGGGSLIDTSPMYGSSERVIGELLSPGTRPLIRRQRVFAATKVWTVGEAAGRGQMEDSVALWRAGSASPTSDQRFDLIQIHNMLDWQTHLNTLKAWKAEGRIRYLGITTSHGSRHEALEAAMKRESFDFVQFTYNLADRSAESRLLPLALDRGAAVIINRPFDGGGLFRRIAGQSVPPWCVDAGIDTWAELFLKFVISHPAVTCAIPATSSAQHMRENMGANSGRLPDAEFRRRLLALWDKR